jgi:DNA-directed RNA polymerase specialized sigma24 family protein
MPRIAELLGISERTGYRELSEGRRKLARRMSRESA